MSNVRIKIFYFNSTKDTPDAVENLVNQFLARPEVIAEPGDISVMPDEFTVVTIAYTIRKLSKSKRK